MDSAQKPGWYSQEGLAPGQKRYWDGTAWTDRVTGGRKAPNHTMWTVIAVLVILAAVAFGLLNFLTQMSRTR